MSLNLSDAVTSPQDLKAIILDVRRYAKWFAQASIKAQVAGVKPEQPPAISQPAATLINATAAGKQLNVKALDGLIAELEELESKSIKIVITLAGVPGNGLKKTLSAWCRQNIAPDILIDFRFNATILGGMVVQFGSHVYDLSFRRRILASRDKFPGVLRRV